MLLSAALLVGFAVVLGTATAATTNDILSRLRAIPGLTVVAEQPVPAPYRFFVLDYTQYVDHRRPAAGTFRQRLTLLHRDVARPMVLHTTGYDVPTVPFRDEPTRLLDANQISVEQRFFATSRPKPADWSKLTIWQAATDHHRIVGALKRLYPAKWISTGGSKGGMTSVYHRRFYPSDVAGTVAYVAPNDVDDKVDVAYDRFFESVGTDPACRDALDDVQVEALRRRGELVARYAAWAAANDRTFTYVGNVDRAFEFLVDGVPWAFWQYGDQSYCASIPSTKAPSDQLWEWLAVMGGADSATDQGLAPYTPYFYQASTELGYPAVSQPHLAALQRYRGQDTVRALLPPGMKVRFDPTAMPRVDAWVKYFGERLLFVYGENDPWTAEPFRLGRGTRDSYRYVAPGANHGADISMLPDEQAGQATAALLRWAGLSTSAGATSQRATATAGYIPALDDVKPVMQRRPVG